jgi:hypothetical protein
MHFNSLENMIDYYLLVKVPDFLKDRFVVEEILKSENILRLYKLSKNYPIFTRCWSIYDIKLPTQFKDYFFGKLSLKKYHL